MNELTKIHFTDSYLLGPTNPVKINLIGAGGTGSQVLTALARMNHALLALGHPGLWVRLFDDDVIAEANLGRQLFANGEAGIKKSVALINRVNRFFGTNWKAVPSKYSDSLLSKHPQMAAASITISCVDTVKARFEIADMLKKASPGFQKDRDRLIYWMDFGNSQYTGQVVLSTVGEVSQPDSKKFIPVNHLPFITEEFQELLQQSEDMDIPSCSLAKALTRQDLFINSTLASLGASLLWNLFREGMTASRGFFLNLKEFRTQALKI